MKTTNYGIPRRVLLALASGLLYCTSATAGVAYHIVERIPADSKYWDYGSMDTDLGRFYVGRTGGVLSLDLKSGQVTEPLFAGQLIHGVVAIPGQHRVVAADGLADELKVFDTAANKALASVKVGGHPDAVAYDLKTNTVITVNKRTQDLSLVSAATWKNIGTIPLHGDPEFAASDGQGSLFVNIADQDRIVSIDLASQKITLQKKLKGCKEPGGMAFDAKDQLIISVCRDVAQFIVPAGLTEVASIPVGKGADAVIWDSERSLALIPAGDDGRLDIIKVRSQHDIAYQGKVNTEKGARSGAVDLATGRIYLPSGRTKHEAEGPGGWHPPTVIKNSFHILVLDPMPSKKE